eukprot:9443939-Pyramimonas_sp.AAC.1
MCSEKESRKGASLHFFCLRLRWARAEAPTKTRDRRSRGPPSCAARHRCHRHKLLQCLSGRMGPPGYYKV